MGNRRVVLTGYIGRHLRFDDPLIGTLRGGDVLVVVKAHRGPEPS